MDANLHHGRQYRRFCATLAVLLLTTASPVPGQSLLQAENLLFAAPSGFKVGYQANHDNRLITEYVPSGETVDDWTQMLTVQIFRGSPLGSAAFLQNVGKRYMDACPATTAKGIFTGDTNGYVVSMLLLKCPNNPGTGKPETTAFRIIKGNDALYSVQRAFRSDPSSTELDAAEQYEIGRAHV